MDAAVRHARTRRTPRREDMWRDTDMAMRRYRRRLAMLLAAAVLLGACGSYYRVDLWIAALFRAEVSATAPASRPAQWATKVDGVAVPNLHCISPVLYRGAQPDAAGFAALKKMGIKTVVNLRDWHSDRQMTAATGLEYYHIPFDTLRPRDSQVAEFLRVVQDPARQPVFVHCMYGSDRTGTMCAAYRLAVCGWSKDQAIAEMTQGGYGFHSEWLHLVEYLRELDVSKVSPPAAMAATSRPGASSPAAE